MGFFDSLSKAWTPETVGETVRGVIEQTFEKQQTGGDVVNGKFVPNDTPKVFRNNQPAMCLVVVLRVAEETQEDNGQRGVYINRPSRLFSAVASALKAANAKEPTVGDTLEVTFTGFDPESANGKARMYSASYTKAGVQSEVAATPAAKEGAVSEEAAALLAKLAQLGVKP